MVRGKICVTWAIMYESLPSPTPQVSTMDASFCMLVVMKMGLSLSIAATQEEQKAYISHPSAFHREAKLWGFIPPRSPWIRVESQPQVWQTEHWHPDSPHRPQSWGDDSILGWQEATTVAKHHADKAEVSHGEEPAIFPTSISG